MPTEPVSLRLDESCSNVLVRNIRVESLNRVQQIAWLKLITRTDFEQNSAAINTAAEYFGISGSGSYEEFDQKRTAYLQGEQFNYQIAESFNLFTSDVTDAQVSAWRDCMLGRNFVGAKGLVKYYNREARVVVVAFYCRPPAGAPQVYALEVHPTNAALATGASIPSSIVGECFFTWTFAWIDVNQPFILAVNVGSGFSSFDLHLPSYANAQPSNNPATLTTYVNPQRADTDLGLVRANETGFLVLKGLWSYGGDWITAETNLTVIVRDIYSGQITFSNVWRPPYLFVPANSRVSVHVNDDILNDNQSKGDDPLRAALYYNLPPL